MKAARGVHSGSTLTAFVAIFLLPGLERGDMRRHQFFLGVAALSVAGMLVSACSGGASDAPEIEPIPTSEGVDAQAGSAAGTGSDDGRSEADASRTDPDAEPEEGESEGDAEVEPDRAEVDVSVIPDEITPEYVEAVLAELEQLYADALRELMLAGEPTIEVTDRLGSAFSEPQYQARLEELLEIVQQDQGRLAEPEDFRARQHQVIDLLHADRSCIYVETDLDASGIVTGSQDPLRSFALLGSPDVERPNNRNPTPWIIYSLPVGEADQLREANPCLD